MMGKEQISAMTLEERILGCLYGGAAGDALGYAVEFDSWSAILARYGEQGIRQYELDGSGHAVVSDDTQMSLFTAEGIVLADGEDGSLHRSIYQAYLRWLATQNGGSPAQNAQDERSWLMKDPAMYADRAPGVTCLTALGSGEIGDIDEPLNDSKGCGAVMRTAVCGFAPVPPEDGALLLGARAGALTHSHPMGWIPAGMLADMICRMTYGRYDSLADVVLASLDAVQHTFSTPTMQSFVKMIHYAVSMAAQGENDEETIAMMGDGWVGDEALAIAVYCALRHQDDLIACLRAAVNHGGDSDSTGAIAGNILGCWLGIDALPQAWRDPLDLRDAIQETAERLIAAARTE